MSVKIALAGNPNSGKTTLFNALTGSNQFVGNWPGVTVEKKEGRLKGHKDVIIMDLPGIYSLSPYTLEEVVARTYLITERPDAIINIIDGTNLERNLYLSTQLMELGIPVICYGLRADFKGDLFPGSYELLVMADKLEEVKTICWCGKKAAFNARFDAQGHVVKQGAQVVIGANDQYIGLCRKHWMLGDLGPDFNGQGTGD